MRFILISCKLPVDDNNTKHNNNNPTDSSDNNKNNKNENWRTAHDTDTTSLFPHQKPGKRHSLWASRAPIGRLFKRRRAPTKEVRMGNQRGRKQEKESERKSWEELHGQVSAAGVAAAIWPGASA